MSVNTNHMIIKLLIGFMLLISAAVVHASSLTDMDGNPASIADYSGKGKWLVVMFWASDCHICNKEAHQYVDLQERNNDNGNIQILGITTDGLENKDASLAYINEHKLNFPNLTGTLEAISGIYYDQIGEHLMGTPTFLIYNPEGKIRAAQGGAVPATSIENFIENNSIARYK